MDFLKKKMQELMDEEKPKKDQSQNGHRDTVPGGSYAGQQQYYPQPGGYPTPGQQPNYPSQGPPQSQQQNYPLQAQQQNYPPQGQQQNYPSQGQQQNFPPPGEQQNYPPQGPTQSYPPPGSNGYQQQQPYGQYGSAAPPQGPPAPYGAPPRMPPGWVAQFEQNGQRWYYVDQSTGRSQWNPPAGAPSSPGPYAPPPPLNAQGATSSYYQSAPNGASNGAPAVTPGASDERGLLNGTQGYGQGQAGGYAGAADTDTNKDKDKDKKKGHSTAMLAAVGVGGLAAGALIGHELTEHSDDDKKETTYITNNYDAAPTPALPAAAPGFQDPSQGPMRDAFGDPFDNDRDSFEERRADLEAHEDLLEAEEDRFRAQQDVYRAREDYEDERDEFEDRYRY